MILSEWHHRGKILVNMQYFNLIEALANAFTCMAEFP